MPLIINNDDSNLANGNVDDRENKLLQDTLENAVQKRSFRFYSFLISWSISSVFFLSVICFSWIAVCSDNSPFFANFQNKIEIPATTVEMIAKEETKKDENKDVKNKEDSDKKENDISEKIKSDIAEKIKSEMANPFLLLLSLLSAVGATLAISVMRFSFSEQKQDGKEISSPVSPVATAIADFLKTLIGLIKKD